MDLSLSENDHKFIFITCRCTDSILLFACAPAVINGSVIVLKQV